MLGHARLRPHAGTSTPRTTSVSSFCMVAVVETRTTSSLRICATQCAQVNCLTIITPCCLLRDLGQKKSGKKPEVNYTCTCSTEMFSVRVSVRFTVHPIIRIRIQLFKGYKWIPVMQGSQYSELQKKNNSFTIKLYLSVLGWSVMLQISQKPNIYSFSLSSIPELLIYNFCCRSCHSCFLQHTFLPISFVQLHSFRYFVTCFLAHYHVRLGGKNWFFHTPRSPFLSAA